MSVNNELSKYDHEYISFMYSDISKNCDILTLNWRSQMDFWHERLKNYCETLNICLFTDTEAELAFIYDDLYPKPFKTSLKFMIDHNLIRPIYSLLPISHTNHGFLDKFFTNIYFFLNKIPPKHFNDNQPHQYFYLPMLMKFSDLIISNWKKEFHNLPFENVIPYNVLKNMSVRWKFNICDFSLKGILAYMQENGLIVIRHVNDQMFIKICNDLDNNIITDVDVSACQLKALIAREKLEALKHEKLIEGQRLKLVELKKLGANTQSLIKNYREYKSLCTREQKINNQLNVLENQLENMQTALLTHTLLDTTRQTNLVLKDLKLDSECLDIIDDAVQINEDLESIVKALAMDDRIDPMEEKDLEKELSQICFEQEINSLPNVPKTLPETFPTTEAEKQSIKI